MADVFGAAAEWFANEPAPYDTPDYTVGEQINLLGHGPIGYMYNPSIVGDPGCDSSSISNAAAHAVAGPGDHWFYLLAEGANPTDGPSPVPQLPALDPNARNLFPNECREFDAVRDSLNAVSLPAQPGEPPCDLVAPAPPGLTANASTGQITGVPTAAGSTTVVFTVSDSSSPPMFSRLNAFSWSVTNNVAYPPSSTSRRPRLSGISTRPG